MNILGFKIGRFRYGQRRRRKVTSKLDRLANVTLLNAAVENPETLFTIINKFGQLELYQDDEIETKIHDLRKKIYKEAAETILISRQQELIQYIDGVIDLIIDTGDRRKKRHDEFTFADTYAGESDAVPIVYHRQRPRARGSLHTSNLSAFLRDMKALTMLINLANQGIQMKGRGGIAKTYAVESSGQWLEMDENEYRIYLRRQQRQERKEDLGYPPDIDQKPGYPGTTRPLPPPPEKNDD